MEAQRLRSLRTVVILFLLSGLAGMLVSATIATRYMGNLPRTPVPEETRMIPRSVSGVVVYQTAEEDKLLTLVEYGSTGVFLVGICLGLVYLRRGGEAYAINAEEEQVEDIL